MLQTLGVRDRFHALTGADSLPYKKPDPRHLLDTIRAAGGTPETAVLIGDSQTDRDTAAAARVASVLVTFRPAGLDVAAMAPAGLLDDYASLEPVLEGVLAAPRAAG